MNFMEYSTLLNCFLASQMSGLAEGEERLSLRGLHQASHVTSLPVQRVATRRVRRAFLSLSDHHNGVSLMPTHYSLLPCSRERMEYAAPGIPELHKLYTGIVCGFSQSTSLHRILRTTRGMRDIDRKALT